MAGIVFATNSGEIDDLWKVTDQVIRAYLQDTDNEKNDDDGLVNKLYNVEKSDKFAEKLSSVTEMGNFEIVDEGDAGIQDEIKQGFNKLIEHIQFMKGFTCTAKAREDSQVDVMKMKAANFLRAYKRTRAQFASDMLCSEGSTITFGGKVLDRTTGDGKALFAQDHPFAVGSGVQSNVFTNPFGTDVSMLIKLANIGRNFKNSSGNVMGYNFDTIIIPSNTPALEETVSRVIGSDLVVGSDFNDINTQKGKFKLVVNHRWQVTDNSEPYILVSSEANKELQAGKFYDRVPLTIDEWKDHKTQNLEWMGRARFSAGFNNWQAYIMGGAKSGTTIPTT